jgi:uridine kinase
MSQQNPRPGFVIAISGAAGAGKTTLVRKVADLLGDAARLHFDDYQSVAQYPQFPTDFPRWIEEGKDLDAWKIPQLLDDLKLLRAGKTIVLPAKQDEVRPARFIVLEEPSGRERAGLRGLIDFVVLLDLPLEIGLARKVVEYFSYCLAETPPAELTEAVQKGVEYFSVYSLAREYYLTLIERVRRDCDLILDGTRPTEELAQEIVTIIQSS